MTSEPVQEYSTQKVATHIVRQLWVSVAVCHQCRFVSLSAPVLYENFYSGQRAATPTPPSRTAPSFMRLNCCRVCIYISLFCYIFLTAQFLCMWFCRRAALPDPTNSSRSTYYFPNTRLWCAAKRVLSLFFSLLTGWKIKIWKRV